jgi:negative regulator of genetic competence, sporulation and motility
MELIRISDRKLKIMLTPTDMCHFELDAERFGEDSAEMHRAFRLLLDEVRKLTDFDADDHRISVQYFPSREGGCEMFISNLQGDDREFPTCAKSLTTLQKAPLQLQPAKRNGSFRRECAYRFESLPNLLLACQRLLKIGYICESSAYRDEQNAYFLILTVTSSSPFSLPDELDFLVEYGTLQNPSTLLLYIREHATLIRSSDAISVLGELA